MITREYRLDKPSDVRNLLALNDSGIGLLLGLIYHYNSVVNQMGYLYKTHADNAHTLLVNPAEIQRKNVRKLELRGKIKQMLEPHGLMIEYNSPSTCIRGIKYRVTKRGTPRRAGSLKSINKAGLFLFSDKYTEEAFLNYSINQAILTE